MRFFAALCATSLLLATTAANAQQPAATTTVTATARTGFQLRVDAVGSHVEVGDAPEKTVQGFQLTTARLLLAGDLAESVSYTLRLNLRSAGNYEAERTSPDGGLAALDRAYIEHRIFPGFALKIGRMPLAFGSIENDYSSIDQYYYSYLNEVLTRATPITAGVELGYAFGKQSIALQAVNGFYEDNEAKGPQHGENVSYALAYRGNFGNGLVRPLLTYSMLSRIRAGEGANRDEEVTYTGAGVGTQISAAGVVVDVEYDMMKKPEFTSYTADTSGATPVYNEDPNPKRDYGSVVTQVAYTFAPVRAFVKYSADTEKTDGDETFKANRAALGAEYLPGIKGFRYHAVIVNLDDDKTSSGKTVNTKTRQYIVGMAAKM